MESFNVIISEHDYQAQVGPTTARCRGTFLGYDRYRFVVDISCHVSGCYTFDFDTEQSETDENGEMTLKHNYCMSERVRVCVEASINDAFRTQVRIK